MCIMFVISEYGSTLYVGMAPEKKMAAYTFQLRAEITFSSC